MGMRAVNTLMSPRASARIVLVLVITASAVIGNALWIPSRAAAEWCGPTMPAKAGFARGYMFTGVLLAKRPQGVRPPAWDFQIETIHAGAGNVPPPGDPIQIRFREGEVLTLYGGCYPPRGLRIGKRYLVSDGNLATFSSLEAVVWQVRKDHRVRLLRQYHSKPVGTWRTYPLTRRMDPRLLGPRTVREAIALMMPPGELPPTDTASPDTGAPEAASIVVRTIEVWLEALLRVVASVGPRASR
jgi:hypothetical protein